MTCAETRATGGSAGKQTQCMTRLRLVFILHDLKSSVFVLVE